MKLTLLSLVIIAAPLIVCAEEPQFSSAVGGDQNVASGPGPGVDEQQPTPMQPLPPPASKRRRGSMVGYIDDAIIESKVRFRFDSGFHDTVPDRAEFFYAKCGCYKDAGADPDAPGPRPGSASDLDFQQLFLSGEYAANRWFSAFIHVPVRWIQPKAFVPGVPGGAPFSDQSGFGDLRAGVKVGLNASDDQSITVQTQFYFPTGDASKGLGTHHSTIEPALLYYRRMSEVVTLEGQFGVWLPFGGSSAFPGATDGHFSGNVVYYGIGPSFAIYNGNRVQFAPVIELVGWHVASGFQTLPDGPVDALRADGTNIVNLKIGGRLTVDRGSFYVGYGHALTDATWYDDIVRVEYRFAF
jgi:hypothetical protein